jgi:hypothetical protein
MRHETALRLLDELDNDEVPGLTLRLHLAACPSCAKAARLGTLALASYRSSPAPKAEAESSLLEDRIMASVRLTPPPKQDFAIRDWLLPAVVIFFSLCLLPLVSSAGSFDVLFGPNFAASVALALGAIFTVYSAFFVATHLEELENFLEKKGLTLH